MDNICEVPLWKMTTFLRKPYNLWIFEIDCFNICFNIWQKFGLVKTVDQSARTFRRLPFTSARFLFGRWLRFQETFLFYGYLRSIQYVSIFDKIFGLAKPLIKVRVPVDVFPLDLTSNQVGVDGIESLVIWPRRFNWQLLAKAELL